MGLVDVGDGGIQEPVLRRVAVGSPLAEGVTKLTVDARQQAVLLRADDHAFERPAKIAVGYADGPRHVAALLADTLEEHVGMLVLVDVGLPVAAVEIGDDEGVDVQQCEVVEQCRGTLLEGDDVGLDGRVNLLGGFRGGLGDVDFIVGQHAHVVRLVVHHDPGGVLEEPDGSLAVAPLLEGLVIGEDILCGGVVFVPPLAVRSCDALDVVVVVVDQA